MSQARKAKQAMTVYVMGEKSRTVKTSPKKGRKEDNQEKKAIKIGMKDAVKNKTLGDAASKKLRGYSKAEGGVSNSITPKKSKAPVKPSSGRMNSKRGK